MTTLPQSDNPKEKLKDFMTSPAECIDVNATVQEAGKQMGTKNVSALIATKNGKHIGIVTERDFTRKIVGEGRPFTTLVSEIMSAPVITMDQEQHILAAIELMADKNIRHLSVTENDQVVGILTIKNTFSYYMKLFGLEM